MAQSPQRFVFGILGILTLPEALAVYYPVEHGREQACAVRTQTRAPAIRASDPGLIRAAEQSRVSAHALSA
jgi:hypothetical protein